MDEATIALTVMTGLLLISFLGLLVWGIHSGQFRNIEDAKYQIFRTRKGENAQANPKQNSSGGGEEQ